MKLFAFLAFAIVLQALSTQSKVRGAGAVASYQAGFSDFAGSGIVHMCGAAARSRCYCLRSTQEKYGPNGEINAIPGCNMPLATLGTLFCGWGGLVSMVDQN